MYELREEQVPGETCGASKIHGIKILVKSNNFQLHTACSERLSKNFSSQEGMQFKSKREKNDKSIDDYENQGVCVLNNYSTQQGSVDPSRSSSSHDSKCDHGRYNSKMKCPIARPRTATTKSSI